MSALVGIRMAPGISETTAADRVRVRDNQRRARARQKEYTQELEEKVRWHEQRGIEATLEMQKAARCVVEDNGRLKAENKTLLEENMELRRLLQVFQSQNGIQKEQGRRDSTRSAADPLRGTACVEQNQASQADRQEPKAAILTEPEVDTSSCEYAAHIITSMRADVSPDDVRLELGCDSSQRGDTCKVDNSRLFQAMDRYAG